MKKMILVLAMIATSLCLAHPDRATSISGLDLGTKDLAQVYQEQEAASQKIKECFKIVPQEKYNDIVTNARTSGLLTEDQYADFKKVFDKKFYLKIIDVTAPDFEGKPRAQMLEEHGSFVCQLAEETLGLLMHSMN
ncbi:MAG: hypothetical protein ACOYOK_06585 [Pseudobdellovibrionaceae bacterium]